MNNWRLLLLAVVAVLQPIGSFTESNLINGREECCDQRSNSVTQDIRLYGIYRKTNSEDRRLNTRISGHIREERHYQARNDPITRLRQRLTLERAERRTSPSARSIEDTRLKNQDRRFTISFAAKETSQTREDQSQRTRDSDVLDSRRISMFRDERTGRRDSVEIRDARTVQNSIDLRRASTNRETMAVLRRENDHVTREVHRNSRISSFRSATNIHLDNIRKRHLDHRARERGNVNRRSLSLDSRLNNVNEREGLRRVELRENRRSHKEATSERFDKRRQQDGRDSYDITRTIRHDDHRREARDTIQRVDRNRRDIKEKHNERNVLSQAESPENRRSNNNAISERVDERRQRNERRSNGRVSTIRHDLSERKSADRRRESRDAIERVARIGREISDHNERNDERRQQHDENRLLSRERSSMLQESRISTTPARESQIVKDVRSERIVRNNNKIDVRETSRNILRASTDTARRQDSRVLRTLEASLRNERLVRSDETKHERREPSTRSLDRDSVLRSSHVSRSIQREYDSRNLAQLSESNVRIDRAARYRKDLGSAERFDERREKRDESRMSRDRTIPMLHDNRDSRNSAERRPKSRSVESLSRIDAQRESKMRGDIRDSVRYENHRMRKESEAPRKQILHRMARDTERRVDCDYTSSDERSSRVREDTRSARLNVRREVRAENMASRDSTPVLNRITRDISTSQQRFDDNRSSRNIETKARLQRTRSLDGIRDERREVHQRDKNRASHDRSSMSRLSRERIVDQRRVDARNELTRNRRDVRMGERFEVSGQQHERRFDSAYLKYRQSRDIASRDGEMNIRYERLSKNLNDRKINERDVRNNILKSQESIRITTEREVQANRRNLVMERMSRVAINSNHGIRMETNLRSFDAVPSGNMGKDTKRDVGTNFRNFAAKIREIDSSDETTENQHAMTWQMVFYTLQGAYICGLLMQMLTEKSNTGKSRNFAWWPSSSKDLVKVD